ncbi:MAG: EamA family transporter [Rhodospirillaceae bacterium]|nr:EamA family transporter [Rhodospirillaceae bacterium]|tara:strand:+ start:15836 stop:16735 length:900 start_codon:yes stop_codon:yes gene_type:complete
MTASNGGTGQSSIAILAVSLLFVVLWSSGHITSKLGLPFIEPFQFLTIRFSLSAILLFAIAFFMRAAWPSDKMQIVHIVIAGLLMHAAYLGGVFVAIDLGLAAGALAVITGIQPILTGVTVGPVLKEQVAWRQWVGLILGFAGVAMVVWEKATFEGTPVTSFIAAFLCLFAITGGTLYQKKFCEDHDIRSMNALQLGVAALVCGAISFLFEAAEINWTGTLVFAIGWQVIVLSAIAYSLFYWLLRRGQAIRVTSLFYLMPPTTAIMGYFLFEEVFGLLGLAGLFTAMLGFWVVYFLKRD